MTTPLTEQDLILLNAYLDGELTAAEHADLEARLAEDEHLQAELESLRVTAALLGMTERVRVPRNFTLDPAVYGRPARVGWWASLGLGEFGTWATAGVTVLAVLVCVGAMLMMRGGTRTADMPSVAQFAPQPPQEVAVAEETEEPAAEDAWMESQPTYAASKLGAADTAAATEEPAAAEPAELPVPAPTDAGGGVGGGPSEEMMTAEADGGTGAAGSTISATEETPLGERNTTMAVAGTPTQAQASEPPSIEMLPMPALTEGELEQANAAPSLTAEEALLQAYTAVVPTPTLTPTWVDGQLLGIPVRLALVIGGAAVLIAGLALVRIILNRRPQ